jgi:hypothetical protein
MLPGTAAEPVLVGYRQLPAHFAEAVWTCSRNVTSQTYGLILARQFCFVQSRRTRAATIAGCGSGRVCPSQKAAKAPLSGTWLREAIRRERLLVVSSQHEKKPSHEGRMPEWRDLRHCIAV